MPKTARFRNRKINFKARLPVRLGLDVHHEEGSVEDYRPPGNDRGKSDLKDDAQKLETGVDKDDEGEYHLQAAISASLAALQSTSAVIPTRSQSTQQKATTPSTSQIPYIPTPDATGTISTETYNEFYRSNAFIQPHGNIRFSDTVEDSILTGEIGGAATYTMDEDDDRWLELWNAGWDHDDKIKEGEEGKRIKLMIEAANAASCGAGISNGNPNVEKPPIGGLRSSPRGKGKESAPVVEGVFRRMTEAELELLMEFFEKDCDARAPSLHTDLAFLPTCQDFEESLSHSADTLLLPLRKLLKILYPHWRQRKINRKGHSIIPQLDFDETNENNPYVCFRRRDVKMARKTRRSDQQNVERLQRIFKDLLSSRDLLSKVLDREVAKGEQLKIDLGVFEARCTFRELKRRAGEEKGDEDVLIGPKREKKRKRVPVEEEALEHASKRPTGATGVLTDRVVRKGTSSLISAVSNVPNPNDIVINASEREKRSIVISRAEAEFKVRVEQLEEWQDAFNDQSISFPSSASSRHFRVTDDYSIYGPDKRDLPLWDQKPSDQLRTKSFRANFQRRLSRDSTASRLRIGRGGRLLYDRIYTPQSPPHSSGEKQLYDLSEENVRQERFRYDRDLDDVFKPEEPAILDDFQSDQFIERFNALGTTNIQLLERDPGYLREAHRWAERPIDKPATEYEVVGKLPCKTNNGAPGMFIPGMNVPGLPAIGAFGIPGVQRLPPNALAMQQRIAAQNAQSIRRPVNQVNAIFNGVPNVAQHWQGSGSAGISLLAPAPHVVHHVPSTAVPNMARNLGAQNGQLAMSGAMGIPTVQVHNSPTFAHPSVPNSTTVVARHQNIPFPTPTQAPANGPQLHPVPQAHIENKTVSLNGHPPSSVTSRPSSSTSVHTTTAGIGGASFIPATGSPILRQKLRSPANAHHLNGINPQGSPLAHIKALNVAPSGFTVFAQPNSSPQQHHVSAQNG